MALHLANKGGYVLGSAQPNEQKFGKIRDDAHLLAHMIRSEHHGQTVFVVGHSTGSILSVPELIEELGGPSTTIAVEAAGRRRDWR